MLNEIRDMRQKKKKKKKRNESNCWKIVTKMAKTKKKKRQFLRKKKKTKLYIGTYSRHQYTTNMYNFISSSNIPQRDICMCVYVNPKTD